MPGYSAGSTSISRIVNALIYLERVTVLCSFGVTDRSDQIASQISAMRGFVADGISFKLGNQKAVGPKLI